MADTPKIRFKGFTDAWEQRKLGDYCEMYNGDRSSKYPNADDMVSDGIPFINAGDLENGTVNLTTCNRISKEKYNDLGGAKLQRGDIVYCLRGTLGKNAFIDNFDEGTVASSLVALRPKNIDGKYLYFILNSDIEYRQRVVRDEGAAQPNLSAKSVSEYIIPVPSEGEQQLVSTYFSKLDILITLHQRKCDETKELKKYMLQKMFPRNGKKIPEIRFAGFTDDWEQRKLEDTVEFLDTMRKPLEGAKRISGPYPYYGASGIVDYVDGYLFDEELVLLSEDGANITDRNYPVCFLASGKYWVNNHAHVLRTNENIDNNFLCTTLERKDYKQYNSGMAMPKLNQEVCRTIPVACPEYDEQVKIGNYFRKLAHLITLHQRKCDELKEVKKFMLQNMFPQKG